jgi:pimeloyl-ACP methyl ester carboxylesterase
MSDTIWQRYQPPRPIAKADQSGFVETDGARVYYEVHNKGAGNPVLFLHGGTGTIWDWGNQLPVVAETRTVVAIETRGHGRSPLTDAPLGFDHFTADVVRVLETLHCGPVAVVGWSDGGIIGLMLAARHSALVRGVFAYGANYSVKGTKSGAPETPMHREIAKRGQAFYSVLSARPGQFRGLQKRMGRMWAREPEISPQELAAIQAPVVIAQGEFDEIIRTEHAKEMASHIPGARFALLKDVSHFAVWQDVEQFNGEMTRFLEEVG